MNIKRLVLADGIFFVTATAFDILINAVILRDAFREGAQFWRPTPELNRLVPLGWFSMLLIGLFFGMLFVRSGWRGLRRGAEFGGWMALASVSGVAGLASLVPWPLTILIGMAIQQAANSLILGLSLGRFYRDREEPRPAQAAGVARL